MTDLDTLLEGQPTAAPSLTGAHGRPKSHRHSWNYLHCVDHPTIICSEPRPGYRCLICRTIRDETRSRRGRNARKRGNSLQAAAAKSAGIANIGALGLPEDAGTSRDWLVLQVKSGNGYPRNLDRWLRALTATADQLRAVVYVETPGPGHKAKRLIVLDYDEFLSWYGGNK